MSALCFYFQVPQPYRLRHYTFFDIGVDSFYEDEDANCGIMLKVARKCYLPMNALLLKLIRKYDSRFKVSFSISGTALEQFEAYAPEVIQSFRELVATGCVELLSETYNHSLAFLYSPEEFREKVFAGVRAYKAWSESVWLEKKPEEIWPEFYLRDFDFPREKLVPLAETLANLWEVTFYHRELRPDVPETLEALRRRGYRLGVISNNASLYNVFDVLEQYGIRSYMEDVTVSSVTGYRKPHPEIFRISLRQMQAAAENCVYVGDTVSRDIIGSKRAGFGKAVQIGSFLSAQKDAAVGAGAEKPDVVIDRIGALVDWLDSVNPAMAPGV